MDNPPASKRLRRTNDPIVGLDVCGKLFYCHQSTLSNASPYFASRFKDDFDSSVAYTDPQGRDVYFVERPPSTFPFILEFVVSSGCHALPSFEQDPILVHNLRVEADFFGLEGLTEALKGPKSIPPKKGNQGVLYWLGTKKGTAEYQNPFTSGAIHVGGWMEDAANSEDAGWCKANPKACRASFVHYRERLDVHFWAVEAKNHLLYCNHAWERLGVELDLQSVSLRPTHYSLRVCLCYGMQGDWNFEGSCDGATWEVLHAARNDKTLNFEDAVVHTLLEAKLDQVLPAGATEDDKADAALDILEKDFRHTWELIPAPTKFYRCFRIIGAGDKREGKCLHGDGIELFGYVQED